MHVQEALLINVLRFFLAGLDNVWACPGSTMSTRERKKGGVATTFILIIITGGRRGGG